jgi:hypothetical protein
MTGRDLLLRSAEAEFLDQGRGESKMEDQETQKPERPKKPQPPLSGLAIVASLWLWGAILLYTPTYLNIAGGWQIPFTVLGAIALIISFGGALLELSKFWKSEALSYWGAGAIFLIPALIFFVLVKLYPLTPLWETLAKIAALVLLTLAGPFFFMGIPHFFWRVPQSQEPEHAEGVSAQEAAAQKAAQREARFTTIASIIIALLSLATAVIKLTSEIVP